MQRIKYFDALRFLAIFGVVALHVFQSFKDVPLGSINVMSFIEIFEFAVPVFLMISGALLLNREMPIDEFLKRRFSRLTYPFILYMIIYAAVLFLLMSFVSGFSGLGHWLSNLPLNYNWYFWTIASLYLAIPILAKFVRHSSFRELEYFITVLIIGCIFYQITLLFGIRHYIDLNLFVSPMAYLVLGYYLANKDFKISTNKIITIALVLFILTTLFKMSGHILPVPMQLIENYEATRSMILSSYIDMGLAQIIQAASLFVFFRYVYESKSGFYLALNNFLNGSFTSKFILSVSMASYGMYLFHHTLIEPLREVVKNYAFTGPQTLLLIIVLTVSIFIISWIVVMLISKIPYIGKYSGFH